MSEQGFIRMQKQLKAVSEKVKKIKDYDYLDFYNKGIKTAGICIVCGRKLVSPKAIARGYGDECAKKL